MRPTEPALSALSPSDKKALARLVRKYGRKTIAAATRNVRLRAPGRPIGPAFLERVHLAQWFEEVEEEYRAAGSRRPFTDAALDLFEMEFDEAEWKVPEKVEKFLATMKDKRKRARPDLTLARKLAQRREAWLKRRRRGRK
jgi:hypothetical protein